MLRKCGWDGGCGGIGDVPRLAGAAVQLMAMSASGEDVTVHDVEEKLEAAGVLAFAWGRRR